MVFGFGKSARVPTRRQIGAHDGDTLIRGGEAVVVDTHLAGGFAAWQALCQPVEE